MIVLVDIDDTLNNFTQTCLDNYNKQNNTNFQIQDVTSYDMAVSLNASNSKNFIEQYILSSNIVEHCTPKEGSVEYLEKINRLCELYIVTSREWCQLTNIVPWFQKYYPYIMDKQIVRCKDKWMIRGDILVDDNLDNILKFPTGRILFDHPWNRQIEDITNFINRVETWKDCYNIIRLITTKKYINKE